MIECIRELMEHDTAGDPISGLKWTRKTTAKVARELAELGIEISPNTVAMLLKDMDFRLRVNHKKLSTQSDPERDEQFAYIAQQREAFTQKGWPIISIDAKKRELVGNFKNPCSSWQEHAIGVNDHDFRSDAKGIAIPFGIYDTLANQSWVFVGVSHETSEFAVNSIAKWWRESGLKRYQNSDQLLILADSGGSNGATRRLWKYALQTKLCDPYGLTVTVSHYPRGASKWNPIEHRVFSEISKNWAGKPLTTYETILKFIRTTKTETGLTVVADLDSEHYETGVKITDQQFKQLALTRHSTVPKRNYTLRPRQNGTSPQNR